MKTKAVWDEQKKCYYISGSKTWITNSPVADVLVVWAKSEKDDNKIRGFILEKGMPGKIYVLSFFQLGFPCEPFHRASVYYAQLHLGHPTHHLGLLKHNDPDHSYFNTITRFTTWCQASNLMLSTDKTKEMVFDFCRTYDITSNVFIDNKPIAKVLEFKYLGISFSHDLKWQANSDSLYKKLKSRFSQSLNHSSRP